MERTDFKEGGVQTSWKAHTLKVPAIKQGQAPSYLWWNLRPERTMPGRCPGQ